MKVKKRLGIALLIACLPWLAMAQNDDLYFVPKKEKKAETKTEVRQVTRQTTTTTTTTASVSPATTVVIKDVTGKTRDIDEYNRRYTSRENTFSMQNDTLYIEEKPYGERGEWVNGFEGSQDDYEYAMRIVRFRSPAYAIPISSPLYWDVVYGAYPSWDWNVYDDGLYAYVFPTFSNPLWWDWRWNWSIAGPRWGYGWGWHSPWYYGGWYSSYWYGGYWGGWYAGYWGPWHHHPYPYWGGGGWHHRPGFTDYRPTRYEGYSSSRRSHVAGVRPSSGRVTRGVSSGSRRYAAGRVVRPGSESQNVSVRPSSLSGNRAGISGSTRPSRGNNSYVRSSSTIDRTGSSYNRPSSTRRTYNQVYNRNVNNSNRSRSYNSNRSNFSNSRSNSYNRGSIGGGSTRTRSAGGGGSSRRR